MYIYIYMCVILILMNIFSNGEAIVHNNDQEWLIVDNTRILMDIPSGKRSYRNLWKDPPFYSWENSTISLGHFQ